MNQVIYQTTSEDAALFRKQTTQVVFHAHEHRNHYTIRSLVIGGTPSLMNIDFQQSQLEMEIDGETVYFQGDLNSLLDKAVQFIKDEYEELA